MQVDIQQVIMENLPLCVHYERSYMHKENVNIILASSK